MLRSELWRADLATSPDSQLYGGRGKRVLIVSNDAHNRRKGTTLATLPRTTRERTAEEEHACVKSPAGDANCDEPGWLDCMQLLRVAKETNGGPMSRIRSGPLGTMPTGRMDEVGAALRDTLSAGEGAEVRFPRGSIISISRNSAATTWLVLSNDGLRARRKFKEPLVLVVLLVELETPSLNSGVEVAVDADAGRRHFSVRPRTARTIDLDTTAQIGTPMHRDGKPVVLPPEQVGPAADAVAVFLEIK